MATSVPWRVVIVEPNPLTRFALGAAVGAHSFLEVCGQTSNAAEALDLCEKAKPELILLDIILPKLDGMRLLGDLAHRHPHSRRLVVSSASDALTIERAAQTGAHAYVTKEDEAVEIIQALQMLYIGKTFFSKLASQAVVAGVADRVSSKSLRDLDRLSNRELQVFRLIGGKHGAKAISRLLGVSVKTVETHQGRIIEKLKLGTAAHLHEASERWIARTKEKL